MAVFETRLTNYGKNSLALAMAPGGVKVTLSAMAVGDGNGSTPDPGVSRTALVHEVYRSNAISVKRQPPSGNQIVCEMRIPASTGGFTVREVGVFDSSGALFAQASFPDTYKPTAAEGATSDLVIRMVLRSENVDGVNLIVDTSIVTATQEFVIEAVATQAERHGHAAFFNSGSFTVPEGVTRLRYRIWGAGGGGAGANNQSVVAGCGGFGGGYTEGTAAVTPGQVIPITVGAAGAGGVGVLNGSAANGANGGTSSVGNYASATGGWGGATLTGNQAGRSAGQGSGGAINLSGLAGGLPIFYGASTNAGGIGGGAFMTSYNSPSLGARGWDGAFPGGGGNGGSNGNYGGNGAKGFVTLEW